MYGQALVVGEGVVDRVHRGTCVWKPSESEGCRCCSWCWPCPPCSSVAVAVAVACGVAAACVTARSWSSHEAAQCARM